MACHEISALRLGCMNLLGIDDPAEKKHEQDELGEALTKPSAIKNLAEAGDLKQMLAEYQNSLTLLEERFSAMGKDDPKRAYYQSLLILTKKVELELEQSVANFKNLYDSLEEMHDYVHEVFPA